VPDFLPFRGLRYGDAPDLSSLIAPPYDVIDEEDRRKLEAADPHNAVRLILPRAAPPADAYAAAAAQFSDWLTTGVITADPTPTYYRYEMRFAGADGTMRRTIGALGALGLVADGRQAVLGHERTLPKARSDRLALLRATRANFDPIWCLALTDGLTELLGPSTDAAETATDADGIVHEVVPIIDRRRQQAIQAAISDTQLVLADGHHRFETACTYRDEQPDAPGSAAILTLIVQLDETMLDVHSIHRLAHDVRAGLRDRLTSTFTVEPVGGTSAVDVRGLLHDRRSTDSLMLVDGEGIARLSPGAAAEAALREMPPVLRDVDAARFDTLVRPELLGASISYRHDAVHVASMVAKGAADAAVLLRPVTIPQIRAAALAGIRMPEKTTFFWPKPRTGMVFRRLDV
jgi:uncharacterized protein (DUF1015 family)